MNNSAVGLQLFTILAFFTDGLCSTVQYSPVSNINSFPYSFYFTIGHYIHLLQWLHSSACNNLRFSSIHQREILFFGCYYFSSSDTIHIYSYKAFCSLYISISQSPQSFFVFLPSYLVGTTYVISASHSKKFSSLIGPAIIPSGGFRVSSETCTK